MSNKASSLLKELSSLCDLKSQAYGPQKDVIKSIFDRLLQKKPITLANGEDVWRFHLLMEIFAKNTRMLNLYVNGEVESLESLVDSLNDSCVYNALLSTEMKEER